MLSTLDAVKNQAGICLSDTSQDAQLSAILAGVSAMVTRMLGRNIEQETYTEYYSGDGSSELLLRQYPVQSITSLAVDGSGYWGYGTNAFATNLVAGTDYALARSSSAEGSPGIVYRIGGVWPQPARYEDAYLAAQPGVDIGNIKVVYVAGFATVPADIQMAVNSLVMRVMAMSSSGMGISSAAYEDASASYMTPEDSAKLFGSIESALRPYKSVVI